MPYYNRDPKRDLDIDNHAYSSLDLDSLRKGGKHSLGPGETKSVRMPGHVLQGPEELPILLWGFLIVIIV